jgi:hypothetical protein
MIFIGKKKCFLFFFYFPYISAHSLFLSLAFEPPTHGICIVDLISRLNRNLIIKINSQTAGLKCLQNSPALNNHRSSTRNINKNFPIRTRAYNYEMFSDCICTGTEKCCLLPNELCRNWH